MPCVKIVSNGRGEGSRVIVNGTDISRILCSAQVSIVVGEPVRVVLDIPAPALQFDGEAEVLYRVLKENGTEIDGSD